MDRDFVNFRARYDELTDEVTRARYQFIPDHLNAWFKHVDDTPVVSPIIQRLEDGLDFKRWYDQQLSSVKSMAGSGKLDFGKDKEKSLGMRLLLFREFAEQRMEAYQFAHRFVYTRGDANDLTRGVIEQLFEPLARELLRFLQKEAEKPIPATDRVVRLDHNSSVYQEAVEALDKLERLLRETNDYNDMEEKEQRRVEVSAARRLFDAIRIRLEPLITLLRPLVTQLATKLKDSLIGIAVTGVITALGALFGAIAGLF